MDGFGISSELVAGFGALLLVFLLVVILGLQIQISGLSRRLDDIIDKLTRLQPK